MFLQLHQLRQRLLALAYKNQEPNMLTKQMADKQEHMDANILRINDTNIHMDVIYSN